MSDEQITWPFLYFTIDNFDELFEGMVVRQGNDACVELVSLCISLSLSLCVYLKTLEFMDVSFEIFYFFSEVFCLVFT